MGLGNFVISLFYIYIIISIIFLLLDNRNPSSTFAWLFIFMIFPIGGIACYILFGKNHKIVGKRRKKIEQKIRRTFKSTLKPFIATHRNVKTGIKKSDPLMYKRKLINLLEVSSLSLLTEKNNVKLIQTGKEKFSLLFKDLEESKKTIHMAYFIWRDDSLTQKLKNILIERAKAGVEVRILIDAVGSFTLPSSYKNELKKNGVHIYRYLDFMSLFSLHTINYRNHRKIVVIDGKISYTGGMNIGKEYIDGAFGYNYWRDTHLHIVGEGTKYLQGIFLLQWETTTQEKLFGTKYFPKIEKDIGNVKMQVAVSGPDSEWESIKQMYFEMICAAKKNIYIQSPYFIPDISLIDALRNAALSGVETQIMITGIPDKKIPYWTAYTYFEKLIEAGVKIFQYKKSFLHSKTIAIDSEICAVGTANFDIRSFVINYELMAVFYDHKLTSDLEKDFKKDIQNCIEITTEKYNKLNTFCRLRNSVARLMSPIL
jgi:cardiolipin synthase A/B